ncbi:MAG TPA: Do family serine endopeptidase [Gammaproteobacteria bacterium]
MIARARRFAAVALAARSAFLPALAALPTVAVAQLPSEQVPSLAPMIERVSPAVVNISISGRIGFPFDQEDPLFRRFLPEESDREVTSSGSGVIVDAERGYILTNHHVVANAERITVTLFDGRSMVAEPIGSDVKSDLAVLKIDARDLTQIEFGDSDRVRVGDFVVAIGNPFGLSHTVTSGIVSGLGRSNISPDQDAYENFIQTDASINPGNSGGALVGLNGELLGINSAILSRNGGNIGIGFAIPVNMARYVMGELIDGGKVRWGGLGVRINPVTPEVASARGLPTTRGAVVASVGPGTAAERAGLRVNDVIVSIDDEAVRDAGSLRAAIGLRPPGERVRIGIIRDGKPQVLEATLGDAEETTRLLTALDAAGERSLLDGVELEPTQRGAETAGLLVVQLDAASAAARRGLRSGDIITRINDQPVSGLDEARAIAANADSLVLDVARDGRSLSIVIGAR